MAKRRFNLSKITFLAATLTAVSFIFMGFPQIDIAVSALFYKPEQNFLLRDTPLHLFVDSWIRPSIKYLAVAFVVACVSKLFFGQSAVKRRFNIVAFLFASFLVGPVLLVNGLLKEFIGRARPKNIIEYGGTKIFTCLFSGRSMRNKLLLCIGRCCCCIFNNRIRINIQRQIKIPPGRGRFIVWRFGKHLQIRNWGALPK